MLFSRTNLTAPPASRADQRWAASQRARHLGAFGVRITQLTGSGDYGKPAARLFGPGNQGRRQGVSLQVCSATKRKGSKKGKKSGPKPDACPCGSKLAYGDCCGKYHAGEIEPTPVATMRARFCAYAKSIPDYVVASTHPDCPLEAKFKQEDGTFSDEFLAEATAFCNDYTFQALTILQSSTPPPDAEESKVVFKVWYVVTDDPGEQVTMTEKGIFRKYGGRWLYYDRLD